MEGQERLIERILAGDNRAFEELIRDYQRLVNHIVFRMIPHTSDREDICQEIFVKVYQNLSGFRSDARLSTWIGRIATNRCLDFLEKKNLPLADDTFEHAVESAADTGKTPDRISEQTDIANLLNNEIAQLPPVYRTIITLYHLDEMNYNEIGEIMDLPEGTVKSYLFRGRKMLRERVAAIYGKEELWR